MTTPDRFANLFADREGTYLLSHSVGLPVRGMREAVAGALDVWEHDTAAVWPNWLGIIDGFRTSLAQLLGADTSSVCPQSNVSSGLTKILGALRNTFDADQPIVLLTEDAFPSIGYVCEHAGYDVRFIGRDEDVLDPATWQRHLANVDVAIVTQVHSNTGELLPVSAIAEVARTTGAVSIVDTAQSVGLIPIDVSTVRADFIVGSCVKWLSGGPGAGWLWADPDMIDRCEPDGGTPTVLPYAAARHSIDAIAQVGVAAVREHNQHQIDSLIDALGPLVVSPHNPLVRSGTCIVTGTDNDVAKLADAGIFVDARRGGLRLSPHLHTTSDDIAHTISELRSRPS
jgi:kynureninase